MSGHLADRAIAVCTGVQNLAFWKSPSTPSTFDLAMLLRLKLRSLCTPYQTLQALSRLNQPFTELTHLSTYFNDNAIVIGLRLEWLPTLTHMRLEVSQTWQHAFVSKVVEGTCRDVRSILVQIEGASQDQILAWEAQDPRVVVKEGVSTASACSWEDWVSMIETQSSRS